MLRSASLAGIRRSHKLVNMGAAACAADSQWHQVSAKIVAWESEEGTLYRIYNMSCRWQSLLSPANCLVLTNELSARTFRPSVDGHIIVERQAQREKWRHMKGNH